MNYLVQILEFNERMQFNPLSSGQIALWYGLMYINNKCVWKEWFTAPTKILETYTGLSRGGIESARNALKQLGFIDFKSNGKKATSYNLTILTSNNVQEKSIEKALEKPNKSTEKALEKPNSSTLNKHKQKQKDIYSASDDTQKIPSTKKYEVFEYIWSKYPEKKGKTQVSKKSKEHIEKLGVEVMEKALDKYIGYVKGQRKTGFNLRYKNGSTWFNSGYQDYLVEAETKETKKEPVELKILNMGYL